jgi:hypothetical protein
MYVIIKEQTGAFSIQQQVALVIRVSDFSIPSGITQNAFTQKGSLLVGLGAGSYVELPPGTDGQYLVYDSNETAGVKSETPTINVADTSNHLMNGGFWLAQRQVPGTFTTIADNDYGPDRWKSTRENADLQYARQDGSGESGLTSRYFGQWKKITNAGKFLLCQPLENMDTLKFRGSTISFQVKLKASASKTIKIAIVELQAAGAADTLPSLVSAWGADGVDPTLGANLALIGTAESCSVTTSWQTFMFTGTLPSTSKNVMAMVWSDADFTAGDTLSLAEAGIYFGAAQRSWAPRPVSNEIDACERYCQALLDSSNSPTVTIPMSVRISTNALATGSLFRKAMRSVPIISNNIDVSAWSVAPTGRGTGSYNYAAGATLTITGALTVSFESITTMGFRLRYTAATSFSGTAGQVCDIRFGPDVIIVASAEL